MTPLKTPRPTVENAVKTTRSGERSEPTRARERDHAGTQSSARPVAAPAPGTPQGFGHSFGRIAVQGRPLQRLSAESASVEGSQIRDAAVEGTRGNESPLPHLAAIQKSFGQHDVSGIKAHLGPAARKATRAIRARAYATSGHVVFGAAPSLRTAAHEAAHVVQQQGGVQLEGGVGQAGDPYERHADAVAEQVVRGRSAEGLLNKYAGGRNGGTPHSQVQRVPIGAAVQLLDGKELEDFNTQLEIEFRTLGGDWSEKKRESRLQEAMLIGKTETNYEVALAKLDQLMIRYDPESSTTKSASATGEIETKSIAKENNNKNESKNENKIDNKNENKNEIQQGTSISIGQLINVKGKLYEVKEKKGTGSFGQVWYLKEVSNENEDGQPRRTSLAAKLSDDTAELKHEASVYETLLEHPNILQIEGLQQLEESKEGKGNLALVMESMGGGTLEDVLDKLKTAYAKGVTSHQPANVGQTGFDKETEYWGVLQYLTIEMLQGLAHMHKNKLVHHDVKPPNIMLNKNMDVKLVDMGASRQIGELPGVGTMLYRSKGSKEGKAEKPSDDLYSVGAMLFWFQAHSPTIVKPSQNWDAAEEIRNKTYVSSAYSNKESADEIQNYENKDDQFVAFVNKLMDHKSEGKLTAVEALEDPWVKTRILSVSAARAILAKL